MSTLMERPQPQCGGCGKRPEDDSLIVLFAQYKGLTPDQYIWQQEGTLNDETGLYACDGCYIKLGMPANSSGPSWKFGDPV